MASGGSVKKVGDFTINVSDILGSGAFGTVTTGTDANGKTVAAKKIPMMDERKARKVSDDLDRLTNLDHQNIVKIFKVDRQQMALWIIMEYCQYGDLKDFFEKRSLNDEQKFKMMHQIAMGVKYLHSEDIIHRDIKPANILIAQEGPVVVKLTDFDCSKFLDPHYVTSCMSTNVGTPAFKAPEFFKRVIVGDKNRIIYHRNIDIYAAGLTFLAMIQGNENLAPRIETANDESELFSPIGQLIAERIKYKIDKLQILSHPRHSEDQGIQQLRELIREMTRPEPTDRISAAQVVQGMQQILKQILSHPRHSEDQRIQQLRELIREMTRPEPTDRISAAQVVQGMQQILKQILREVRTKLVMTSGSGLYSGYREKLKMMQTGHVVIWGQSSRESPFALHIFIKSPEGLRKVREVKGFCEHDHFYLMPFRAEFLALLCGSCQKIRLYNVLTTEVTTAFHHQRIQLMAAAEEGVMYVRYQRGVLKLNTERIPFTLAQTIDVELQPSGWNMIHIPAPYNLLVFNRFSFSSPDVFAVSCDSGEKRWKYSGDSELSLRSVPAMCYSQEHQVLVVSVGSRIWVLDPEDGSLINTLELGERFRFIRDLHIHDETLIVYHKPMSSLEPTVSFFALESGPVHTK